MNLRQDDVDQVEVVQRAVLLAQERTGDLLSKAAKAARAAGRGVIGRKKKVKKLDDEAKVLDATVTMRADGALRCASTCRARRAVFCALSN